MSSYESLALRYDALTADVDHEAWADYLEKHFSRSPIPIRTVLDLPAAPAPSPACWPGGAMR